MQPPPELPILFSSSQIQARVAELGSAIAHDFKGEPLVLIGVLKGASIFLADLARAITLDCSFDFLSVASYGGGTTSSGQVQLVLDLSGSIQGKNVVLVEDILDTGLTLSFLRKLLMARQPRTLRLATLLDKPSRRIEPVQADYTGFSIPDHFVVGYGMDFAERYRNLPDIRILPGQG